MISPDDLAVLEGLTIPRLPPNALPQVVGFLVENDLDEHRMGPKTSYREQLWGPYKWPYK